jgi:hypothetical protein
LFSKLLHCCGGWVEDNERSLNFIATSNFQLCIEFCILNFRCIYGFGGDKNKRACAIH